MENMHLACWCDEFQRTRGIETDAGFLGFRARPSSVHLLHSSNTNPAGLVLHHPGHQTPAAAAPHQADGAWPAGALFPTISWKERAFSKLKTHQDVVVLLQLGFADLLLHFAV